MTDYYVDSSARRDGNGTKDKPWNNINGHLRDLDPGDTLHLRGGTSPGTRHDYDETLAITGGNRCRSGSSGSEITITNHPGEYVRLHSTASRPLVDLNRDYWVIEGQSFDVGSADPYFEVDRQDVGSSGYAFHISGDHNTLKYLHIHNGDYNPSLVRIANASNNTISHCRIHDNAARPGRDHHGVYLTSNSEGTPTDNNVVEYCHIYDCAGDCVQLQAHGTGTLAANIIRHCTLYTTLGGSSENAIDDKDGSGTTIHDCVMYGFRRCDGSTGGTGSDGQAIVLQTNAQNTKIHDNEIYDISGAAIRCDVDGAVFRHNCIHHLVDEDSIGEQTIIYITRAQNVKVHNNTIVGGYAPGTNSYRTLPRATVDLKNNIFKDTFDILDEGTTTYDHNCWHNCSAELSGPNDVRADALFVNEAAADYALQVGSPCVNRGVDLGYPFHGTSPDIGAFECKGVVIPGLEEILRILSEMDPKLEELRALERIVSELDAKLEEMRAIGPIANELDAKLEEMRAVVAGIRVDG